MWLVGSLISFIFGGYYEYSNYKRDKKMFEDFNKCQIEIDAIIKQLDQQRMEKIKEIENYIPKNY